MKNLDSFVSGKIARTNPLEGGPAYDAAIEGRPNIADTWGGYVTRLMDYHDLSPEDAIAALGVTKEQLADPDVQFTTAESYEDFKYWQKEKYSQEAKIDLDIEVKRLISIVDEV